MDPQEKNKEISKNQQEKLKKQADQKARIAEIEQEDSKTLRSKLSNKNSDYIFRLEKALQAKESPAKAKKMTDSLLVEIMIAQGKGIPASTLYKMSPLEKADTLLNPIKKIEPTKFWQRAVDNALLYLAIFTAIVGITTLFTNQKNNSQMGILTLFSVGAIFGVLMTYYNDLMMNGKRPSLLMIIIGGIVIVVTLFGWITLLSLKVMAPINPVLPAWAELVIAAVAFVFRHWFRGYYHVTTSALNPGMQNKSRD